MKRYNWAILGCGRIAGKFSKDLKLLPNARLYAAASRSLKNAREFADEEGFEMAYGSYEEMVNDPKVDIVYVATPHAFHKEQAMMCLNKKKAVLCEKALAINGHEVREMIECAKRNNTFLMEAFWTLFQPSYIKAMEILRSGELGEIKSVRSDFAFNAPFLKDRRLYNPSLGGGSLLDIGIYPVFAALTALGIPDNVKSIAEFSETGTEESIGILFQYKDGKMASLNSGFSYHSPIQTEYWCEKGYLVLNPRWHAATNISVVKQGEESQTYNPEKPEGAGYHLEAAHVMKCLDEGRIESDTMTWDMSMDLMDTLDRIRMDAGIFYENHDEHLKKE